MKEHGLRELEVGDVVKDPQPVSGEVPMGQGRWKDVDGLDSSPSSIPSELRDFGKVAQSL